MCKNILVTRQNEAWVYVIVPRATHYDVHMILLSDTPSIQTASLKQAREWCERSARAREASIKWVERRRSSHDRS